MNNISEFMSIDDQLAHEDGEALECNQKAALEARRVDAQKAGVTMHLLGLLDEKFGDVYKVMGRAHLMAPNDIIRSSAIYEVLSEISSLYELGEEPHNEHSE